ncbi:hypothetical protein ACVGWR_28015, partial [Enterobacter hormaechei]
PPPPPPPPPPPYLHPHPANRDHNTSLVASEMFIRHRVMEPVEEGGFFTRMWVFVLMMFHGCFGSWWSLVLGGWRCGYRALF